MPTGRKLTGSSSLVQPGASRGRNHSGTGNDLSPFLTVRPCAESVPPLQNYRCKPGILRHKVQAETRSWTDCNLTVYVGTGALAELGEKGASRSLTLSAARSLKSQMG